MANKKIIPVVDALKELYGKLGGTPADVEDISTTTEIIQEIADVASPGGGGGGGGSNGIVRVGITETVIDPSTTRYYMDKTFSEILELMASNMLIVSTSFAQVAPSVVMEVPDFIQTIPIIACGVADSNMVLLANSNLFFDTFTADTTDAYPYVEVLNQG